MRSTAKALLSCIPIVRQRDRLRSAVDMQQTQLAELQSQYDQVPAEMKRRIARQAEQGYRLPDDVEDVILQTSIGQVRLAVARGYYRHTAIFAYFPDGFGFSTEIAKAFLKATDGEFRMEPAPGSSQGGDSDADAIFSAGHDYSAYLRGEQGYFKMSPAPRLEETADILSRIIIQIHDGAAAHS